MELTLPPIHLWELYLRSQYKILFIFWKLNCIVNRQSHTKRMFGINRFGSIIIIIVKISYGGCNHPLGRPKNIISYDGVHGFTWHQFLCYFMTFMRLYWCRLLFSENIAVGFTYLSTVKCQNVMIQSTM